MSSFPNSESYQEEKLTFFGDDTYEEPPLPTVRGSQAIKNQVIVLSSDEDDAPKMCPEVKVNKMDISNEQSIPSQMPALVDTELPLAEGPGSSSELIKVKPLTMLSRKKEVHFYS